MKTTMASLRPIRALCGFSLVAFAALAPAASARPPEGGYFAFGLGYAAVSGDRGVPLAPRPNTVLVVAPGEYDEVVRTDFGAGLGFEVRFGWRFGPIAPELTFFGHGAFDFENGAGYPGLKVRFHPLMLVDSLADSKLDGSVYLGAGYVIGGYTPEGDDDGKGWEGWFLSFGLGGTYELSHRVHLGLDLKFVLPRYSSWIFDRDDDITFEPEETPSTLVIAPSLTIQACF